MGERCGVCGRGMPDIETAVDLGWEPEFWLTETQPGVGPICPACVRTRTEPESGLFGEPILLPGVIPLPAKAADR